ncbi:DsbC family protein [Salmonella enterica]|nr:DsbC family protein [Salmonella enterica]EBW6236192.1 DsbC family protein [Salmonella enterica subsp. enterica serovar Enteritidis]EDF1875407.1 thioredoxin fold domain-containing protein [Salmonella enterica subsp. enterica serovar Enteritidis]
MKLTVKTDRNTLYLSADGSYQEQALHSFPLSTCHFGLAYDSGSGHILTHNTFSGDGEAAQLFRFENEYQAIEALNNIRKKLKQQRGLNVMRRLSNFIFWPVAALGFIVSINGALMNMNQPALPLQANTYVPAPGLQQPATAPEQLQVEAAPEKLSDNYLLSLKDAVTSGRFTISLSTGHKHTLYVFSDPMCPHCRALEPRLQELSKRYNVEIFPVSVYGDLRSMVRAAPVLDTGKDSRLKSWEDTINMGYITMNPKIDDPKAVPVTTGARLVDANNMAFVKFGFIGTPSIVADSGDVIPVSVVKDDARLQQAIGE